MRPRQSQTGCVKNTPQLPHGARRRRSGVVCVAVFHFRAPFESISAPQAVRSLPRRSHGTVASEAGRRTVSQSWPAVVPREEGAEQEERGRKNGFTARGKKAKVGTGCFISTPDSKCVCALSRDDRLLAEMEKRWRAH
jgi:hypothetical protein